jgi:hypothetical protein
MALACKGGSDAVPQKTACEWMREDRGKVKKLPERVSKKRKTLAESVQQSS